MIRRKTTICLIVQDMFRIHHPEALHILWERPVLNKQVRHLDVSLSF